ncbi:xanthine dehydrogenase family protein molybdopterin-binding subunit [Cognatishimia sp. MH4019]|uniref:xanthine dehydrogenase family protein molybdopterin-binding subunit n=1 Tax=Cognatishimia sp. MH4019 TaxID=2854030 RepID=UPI001CD2BA74|nr:molybdopterin cofactor-binding domain-containing protein [Cognatishimia sp. MH4019]
MGRLKTIARRTFLIGSAAVIGGVAFGVYTYRKPVKNPLEEGLAQGEAALTPYVKIDADGITLITPRAEVGQGAYMVQAALIAEELDVRLDQITADPGVPSAAYYNGTVAAEGFPLAATDDRLIARTGRGAADVAGKLLGLQLTGGSSTVPDAFEKLRVAGAVARATLLRAASEETGIPVDQLSTKDGAVVLPDGGTLAYTALATQAAGIETVQDVALKDPSEWRYIGKDMQRIDIVAKSTGTQEYGIDLQMDGMLHATVKCNPRMGGEMVSYDATEAETMSGVKRVVPITGGVGVLADNTWRAFQAAEAVTFEWGEAPYPSDDAAMWDQVAASFTADRQDSQFRDDGDVEAMEVAVEAEYRIPYLAHAPLEPMTATVLLDGGRLDIWTGTQIPRFMQVNAAKLAGLDAAQVHVHVLVSGGSFGRRLEDDYVLQAVELAMAEPGVPIKLTWSREEDMSHDFPRPLQMARARGAVSGGQVTGFDLGIAAPSVAASQLGRLGQPAMGPDVAIVAGAWDQPYTIPDYRVTGYRVPPMVPVSSWRSVGASGNGFLHEGFLDEVIHAAGADPLEERLRLCWHEPSRRVLEAVGEMSNWGEALPGGRGRGVAFTLSFGVPTAEVVEVTATDRGIRLDKVYVACEVGRVIDPVNFDNQVKGGVIWGLGHAMMSELTYSDGMAEQTNYDGYPGIRMYQTPEIEVRALETDALRGIGEPSVPPAAPALANAIFAATGQRIRELPLNKSVDFV